MIKQNSQAGRLLHHFLQGKTINRLEALIELGIFELSSRIIDIENYGYNINKIRKSVTNRFGENTRITEYSLSANQKIAAQ